MLARNEQHPAHYEIKLEQPEKKKTKILLSASKRLNFFSRAWSIVACFSWKAFLHLHPEAVSPPPSLQRHWFCHVCHVLLHWGQVGMLRNDFIWHPGGTVHALRYTFYQVRILMQFAPSSVLVSCLPALLYHAHTSTTESALKIFSQAEHATVFLTVNRVLWSCQGNRTRSCLLTVSPGCRGMPTKRWSRKLALRPSPSTV